MSVQTNPTLNNLNKTLDEFVKTTSQNDLLGKSIALSTALRNYKAELDRTPALYDPDRWETIRSRIKQCNDPIHSPYLNELNERIQTIEFTIHKEQFKQFQEKLKNNAPIAEAFATIESLIERQLNQIESLINQSPYPFKAELIDLIFSAHQLRAQNTLTSSAKERYGIWETLPIKQSLDLPYHSFQQLLWRIQDLRLQLYQLEQKVLYSNSPSEIQERDQLIKDWSESQKAINEIISFLQASPLPSHTLLGRSLAEEVSLVNAEEVSRVNPDEWREIVVPGIISNVKGLIEQEPVNLEMLIKKMIQLSDIRAHLDNEKNKALIAVIDPTISRIEGAIGKEKNRLLTEMGLQKKGQYKIEESILSSILGKECYEGIKKLVPELKSIQWESIRESLLDIFIEQKKYEELSGQGRVFTLSEDIVMLLLEVPQRITSQAGPIQVDEGALRKREAIFANHLTDRFYGGNIQDSTEALSELAEDNYKRGRSRSDPNNPVLIAQVKALKLDLKRIQKLITEEGYQWVELRPLVMRRMGWESVLNSQSATGLPTEKAGDTGIYSFGFCTLADNPDRWEVQVEVKFPAIEGLSPEAAGAVTRHFLHYYLNNNSKINDAALRFETNWNEIKSTYQRKYNWDGNLTPNDKKALRTLVERVEREITVETTKMLMSIGKPPKENMPPLPPHLHEVFEASSESFKKAIVDIYGKEKMDSARLDKLIALCKESKKDPHSGDRLQILKLATAKAVSHDASLLLKMDNAILLARFRSREMLDLIAGRLPPDKRLSKKELKSLNQTDPILCREALELLVYTSHLKSRLLVDPSKPVNMAPSDAESVFKQTETLPGYLDELRILSKNTTKSNKAIIGKILYIAEELNREMPIYKNVLVRRLEGNRAIQEVQRLVQNEKESPTFEAQFIRSVYQATVLVYPHFDHEFKKLEKIITQAGYTSLLRLKETYGTMEKTSPKKLNQLLFNVFKNGYVENDPISRYRVRELLVRLQQTDDRQVLSSLMQFIASKPEDIFLQHMKRDSEIEPLQQAIDQFLPPTSSIAAFKFRVILLEFLQVDRNNADAFTAAVKKVLDAMSSNPYIPEQRKAFQYILQHGPYTDAQRKEALPELHLRSIEETVSLYCPEEDITPRLKQWLLGLIRADFKETRNIASLLQQCVPLAEGLSTAEYAVFLQWLSIILFKLDSKIFSIISREANQNHFRTFMILWCQGLKKHANDPLVRLLLPFAQPLLKLMPLTVKNAEAVKGVIDTLPKNLGFHRDESAPNRSAEPKPFSYQFNLYLKLKMAGVLDFLGTYSQLPLWQMDGLQEGDILQLQKLSFAGMQARVDNMCDGGKTVNQDNWIEFETKAIGNVDSPNLRQFIDTYFPPRIMNTNDQAVTESMQRGIDCTVKKNEGRELGFMSRIRPFSQSVDRRSAYLGQGGMDTEIIQEYNSFTTEAGIGLNYLQRQQWVNVVRDFKERLVCADCELAYRVPLQKTVAGSFHWSLQELYDIEPGLTVPQVVEIQNFLIAQMQMTSKQLNEKKGELREKMNENPYFRELSSSFKDELWNLSLALNQKLQAFLIDVQLGKLDAGIDRVELPSNPAIFGDAVYREFDPQASP